MADFDDEIKRYSLELILMNKEAYPYLKGFLEESTADPIWCNGWDVYCQPWNKGSLNIIQHIEPPIRDIERFRILKQEEIQAVYMEITERGPGETFFRLCQFKRKYQGWLYQYNLRDITSLWMCFLMENCFNRLWDSEKKKWVLKEVAENE